MSVRAEITTVALLPILSLLLFTLVRAQNGPELMYNFTSIDNNSLLSLEDLGEEPRNILRCLTTSPACCRPSDTVTGTGVGNWYLPSGQIVSELAGASQDDPFYIQRENGSVDLYTRNSSIAMEGIYRCELPLGAGENGSAYVGLYYKGNGLPVITSLVFDPNEADVACLSMGGPVTEVTWFINDTLLLLNESIYFETQMIISTINGTYSAVLSASDANLFAGDLECVVSNSRGEYRSTITVDTSLPHNPVILSSMVTATSLTLTWQGSTSGMISFYELNVSYTGPCQGEAPHEMISMNVTGGSTSRTVNNLAPDSTYHVTLVAVNEIGRSEVIVGHYETDPAAPSGSVQNLQVVEITMTTIMLSWEPLPCLSRNGNITSYRVKYSSPYSSSPQVKVVQAGIGMENVTIRNLIPGTLYMIDVEVFNSQDLMGTTVSTENSTLLAAEPALMLNGRIVPNNTILNIHEVMEGDHALFCVTNLSACCGRRDFNGTMGLGNWFDANNSNIPTRFATAMQVGVFYDNRGRSVVRLNRVGEGVRTLPVPEGLFRCLIPDANNSDTNFYVGVYDDSGGVVSSELMYDTATISLICRSSGGPASLVTWTEGGMEIDTTEDQFDTYQMVVNTSSSSYDSVLVLRRVNERDNVGNYSCTVSNSRSNDSAQVEVREPRLPAVLQVRVGSRSTFNCSSADDSIVDTLYWLNSTGGVVAMAMNSFVVTLVLEPTSLPDNGTQYSCRITNGITATATIQLELPSPPTMLQVNSITPTSAILMWVEPEDAISSVLHYDITCTPLLEGLAVYSNVTGAGATRVELMGLEEGVTYTCTIRSGMNIYMSEGADVDISTVTIPPGATPTSFRIADVTARSATFSWQPLPLLDRNGMITSYTLSCNASRGGMVSASYGEAGSFLLSGFTPDETYICALWGSNSAGRGPEVTMTTTFLNDDSFFQIRFPVIDCGAWVLSATLEKRRDIEAEVLRQLSIQCKCELNSALIQNGRFTECVDSTSVTYRASIQGIANITSQEFVEDIQMWVQQERAFTVFSVQMRPDASCPVMISSLDATGCSTSSPQTISLTIIVAACVGGVILFSLCCIIIIVVVFCLRKRKTRRKKLRSSTKNNFDLSSYRVTLQNTNIPDDDSSEDENYAHIGPKLPARPASVSDMRSHSTGVKGMHNRSASQHSLRYIRGPKGTVNVTDGTDGGSNYAEIDIMNSKRLRQRRPSDYEPVLVRNIGLMSTEALNSLSPSSLPKDEEDATANKLGDFELPNIHPAVENDYEAMRNMGFLSTSIPMINTGNMPEAGMSEDESEVVRNVRALSLSTTQAPNPMYSTSTSTLQVQTSPKRISESNLDNWVSPRRGDDGYSIPNKVTRPTWAMEVEQPGGDAGNSHTHSVEHVTSTSHPDYPSSANVHPSHVLYNVPNVPAQRSTGNLNPSGKEMAGSTGNHGDKSTFSPIEDASHNNQSSGHATKPQHSNHVWYNIPSIPPQNVPTNNHLSSGNTVPQTYDIPPKRDERDASGKTSLSGNGTGQPRPRPGNETYDIPKSGTKGRSLYDIPTSSDKLQLNVISGTGSSEIKT